MKKNILIFGHSYATQFIDVNNQYTKLFDKNKFEVTVVYLTGNADEDIRAKHLADHVEFLDSPKKSTRGLKIFAIKKMLELCRKKNFYIAISHRFKPTYIMLWVSRFCQIPLQFSIMHELGTLKAIRRKLTIAALVNKNFIFAGVSDAVRDDMRKHIWRVPNDRVITLHNMIDMDLTLPHFIERNDARKKLSISDDIFLFGNVGRLAINKDQTTLIKAFALIKPKCPRAKLVLIGDGHLEVSLKTLVHQLQLDNDVIFAGFVPNGYRLMKAFDVYISSSIQEAFGRVLLEAMAAKIPVIATRVNGVPEVVGDAGKLIDAKQPDILANEMLQAYQSDEKALQKWGNQGFERVTKHFSVQRFNEIFWQLPHLQLEEQA